jgi:hypothetical protein
MGVSGIGGGGGRPISGPLPNEAAGVRPAEGAHGTSEARGVERAPGTTPLDRLGRGEIDLDGYLDTRVEEAVRQFHGRLPEAQLDFVKRTLREELASDPVLVEFVRRTTGSVPTPRTD